MGSLCSKIAPMPDKAPIIDEPQEKDKEITLPEYSSKVDQEFSGIESKHMVS